MLHVVYLLNLDLKLLIHICSMVKMLSFSMYMVCLIPTSSSLNLSYVSNTDVLSRCVVIFSAFHDYQFQLLDRVDDDEDDDNSTDPAPYSSCSPTVDKLMTGQRLVPPGSPTVDELAQQRTCILCLYLCL